MKEYITKNRAKQFVCRHCNKVCSEEPCEPSDCDWMAFIDKEPAADVVEVRHGQKLRPRRRSSRCCCDDSTCNGGVIRNTNQRYPNGLYPICPHCGAKLDIKRCLRRNSDDANIRRYY